MGGFGAFFGGVGAEEEFSQDGVQWFLLAFTLTIISTSVLCGGH